MSSTQIKATLTLREWSLGSSHMSEAVLVGCCDLSRLQTYVNKTLVNNYVNINSELRVNQWYYQMTGTSLVTQASTTQPQPRVAPITSGTSFKNQH